MSNMSEDQLYCALCGGTRNNHLKKMYYLSDLDKIDAEYGYQVATSRCGGFVEETNYMYKTRQERIRVFMKSHTGK